MKKINSGLYSCQSETTLEWSNVTLDIVLVAEKNPMKPVNIEMRSNGSIESPSTENQPIIEQIDRSIGDWVKLRCNLNDFQVIQVSWTKDGKPFYRRGSVFFEKFSIQLEDLKVEDNGFYTCHACNRQGCVNSTTELNVTKSETTYLNDVPALSQLSNFSDDQESQGDETTTDEDRPEDDADNNDEDEQYLDPSLVAKLGKPYFTKRKQMHPLIAKPSGNMVRLMCPAQGDPKPTIKWTKDNESVIVRKMGTIILHKWSITIEDLVPSDSGAYKCEVCNIHGCIDFNTKLFVQGMFNVLF